MDTNRTLLLLVGLSAAILLFRSIRRRTPGFALAALPPIIAAAAGSVLFPDTAGYIAATLWGFLVMLPLLGQRVLARAMSRQRYAAAARVARVLRFLHPTDGWWERPRLYDALDLGRRGRVNEATAILERLSASPTAFGREARVHLLRMRGSWESVLAWIEENLSADELKRDPALLPMYLRALGETGALERLVTAYAASAPHLERAGFSGLLHLCQLFVFAFTGRAERVAALFHGPLADYPEPLQAFWRATADLARAPSGPARARLESLLTRPDEGLRRSVSHRLARKATDPRDALGPAARATLDTLERERDQEERYGPVAARFRPVATFALMIPILIMFVAQQLDVADSDGERVASLYALGGMAPEAVLAGEWWRLVAATLLHDGPVHLLLNLGGLYVLGPYVEYALGRRRYILVYEASGIGMMLVVVLLFRAGLGGPQILVGASGAIMGLVGATAAVLLRGRRVEGARAARRRLWGVVFIIAAQTAFDALMPQVSSLSHAGGVLLGFLLTSVMAHRVTRRSAPLSGSPVASSSVPR